MAKQPPDRPKEGDRVKLRGRTAVGTLSKVNQANGWCGMKWDDETPGPKIVHLNELEKSELN